MANFPTVSSLNQPNVTSINLLLNSRFCMENKKNTPEYSVPPYFSNGQKNDKFFEQMPALTIITKHSKYVKIILSYYDLSFFRNHGKING